jgi:hypothetical protein
MGLVGAVPRTRSTWVNANASETESAELRREYEAGLAELATHGLQVVESIGLSTCILRKNRALAPFALY